jgi:O-antigen/teichoic acid export membrane protein
LQKLIAIALRGGGILGKFLLTFLLTKKISLEFQGEFSLMNANIALLVIFIGFDFYIYSNRLIVKDKSSLIFIFKNSLVFYLCSYLILIPICYLLLKIGLVPKEVLIIFFILSVLEHLGQELFRIYIAIEKVVFANILFFLRSGVWSWIVVVYLYFDQTSIATLSSIFSLWIISTLAAIIIGIIFLPGIREFKNIKIDGDWIKKGLRVGASVFLATILLKAIEYSDRYLIDYFLGKKELGIYAFYFQLANIINVLVFTLYISFIYPKILRSVYDRNKVSVRTNKLEIYKNTLLIVFAMLIAFIIGIPFVLEAMNKQPLETNKSIFYILLLGAVFFNFSFGSHYVLIAEEKEKLIIKTTLIAFVINISLNLILIPTIGIYGASIALAASSFALWISKSIEEKKLLKQW